MYFDVHEVWEILLYIQRDWSHFMFDQFKFRSFYVYILQRIAHSIYTVWWLKVCILAKDYCLRSTSCFLNTVFKHFNSLLTESLLLLKAENDRFISCSFSPDLDKGNEEFFWRASSMMQRLLKENAVSFFLWNILSKLWCLVLQYWYYGHQMNVKGSWTRGLMSSNHV